MINNYLNRAFADTKGFTRRALATVLSFGLIVTTTTQPIAFFAALTPLAVAVLPESNAEAGNLQCFQCPGGYNPLPDGTCATLVDGSSCHFCTDTQGGTVQCTSCPANELLHGNECCGISGYDIQACPTNISCTSCDAASLGYLPDNSGNGTCTDPTPAPGFPATVGCSEIPTQTFPTPNTSLCSQQGQAGCCQFCPSGTNPTADGRCTTAVGGLNAANVDTCATLNDGCIVNNTLVGPCSCTSCPAGTTFITDTNFNFCYSDATQFQICPPPQPVCASDEVYLVNNLGAAQGYNFFDANCIKTAAACLGGVLVPDQDTSAQGGKRCVCEAGKLGYFDATTKNVVCVADPAFSEVLGNDSVAGYCKNNPTTGEKRIALEVGINNSALGIPSFSCVDESRACLDGYLQTDASGVSSCHCDFQTVAQSGNIEFSKTAQAGGGYRCDATYDDTLEACPDLGQIALYRSFGGQSANQAFSCVKQETACIGGNLNPVLASDGIRDDYTCRCSEGNFRFYNPVTQTFKCLPDEAKSGELCKFTPEKPVFREVLADSTTFSCLPQTASCDGGYIRTDANGVSTCDCGSQAAVEASPDGGINCLGTLVIGGIDFSINNPLCQTCGSGFISSLDGQSCISTINSNVVYPCNGDVPTFYPFCTACAVDGYLPDLLGLGGCLKNQAALSSAGFSQEKINGLPNRVACGEVPASYYQLESVLDSYCSKNLALVKPDAEGPSNLVSSCYQINDSYTYSGLRVDPFTKKVSQQTFSAPVTANDIFPVRPTAAARAKLTELENEAVDFVMSFHKVPASERNLVYTNARDLLLGLQFEMIKSIFAENDTSDPAKQDIISYYENLVRSFRVLRARTAIAEYNIWNNNPCSYLYNVPSTDIRSSCPAYTPDANMCFAGIPNVVGQQLNILSGDSTDPDPPNVEAFTQCGGLIATDRLTKAEPFAALVMNSVQNGVLGWAALGAIAGGAVISAIPAALVNWKQLYKFEMDDPTVINPTRLKLAKEWGLKFPEKITIESDLETFPAGFRVNNRAFAKELSDYTRMPSYKFSNKVGKFFAKTGLAVVKQTVATLEEINELHPNVRWIQIFKGAKLSKLATGLRVAGPVFTIITSIITTVMRSIELNRTLQMPIQLNDALNAVLNDHNPIPKGIAEMDESLAYDLFLAYVFSTLPATVEIKAPAPTNDYPKFLVRDENDNIVGDPNGVDSISVKVPPEHGSNATVRLVGNNWLVLKIHHEWGDEELYRPYFKTIDWSGNNTTISRIGDNTFAAADYETVKLGWDPQSLDLDDLKDANIEPSFQYLDQDGNYRVASVITGIDAADPTISGSKSPAANAQGWNNTDVTVSFTCSDDQAIQTCSQPSTLSSEGANQSVVGTATDTAGKSASTSVSVNIDKTPPSGSYATNPAANSFGWFNQDVLVDLTCSDGLSGIQAGTCDDFSFTGEGLGVGGTFHTIFDNAGNSKTLDIPSVNIDKTAPGLIGAFSRAPDASGWYNAPVSVSFTCSDALSGVASCPATTVIATEGQAQALQAQATDKAGNSASYAAVVSLDLTPPNASYTTVPSTANANGWFKEDIVAHFICSDALSGVLPGVCNDMTFSTEGAGVGFTLGVLDNAGNSRGLVIGPFNLDKTLPTITASVSALPNANNWLNTGAVVSFTCSDALSGIDTCQGPTTLSEGILISIAGQAVDKAGNAKVAAAGPFNVDLTPPTITLNIPTNGAVYALNQNVVANWNAEDLLSGVDLTSVTSTRASGLPIDTSTTGTKSFTVSVLDRAGNPRSITVNYSVQYTTASVFSSPIDAGVLNTAKAGKAIPVKWTLTDSNGNPITNLATATLTSQQIVCPSGSGVVSDPIEEYAVGGSGLQNLGGGNYQINWATQSTYSNTCRRLFLNLGDGADRHVDFFFTRK